MTSWTLGQDQQYGHEQADVQAQVLPTPPKIDGVIDAEEWPDTVRRARFYGHENFEPCPEEAEFWLGYDERFVYFAARAKTDPGRLLADEYRQNVNLQRNDHFLLGLDTFGNLQQSNNFQFNPRGANSIRIAGGRAAKPEWLGEVESRGRTTPQGWECEARIPWSIMSLPPAGRHDIRFNVLWYRSCDRRYFDWRAMGEDPTKMAIWKDVQVPQISKGREIKLLPYGYAGFDDDSRHITDFGLDMKSDLTETMHAIGTINPDFRNIENNILNLDFSYFERLAQDARPFFQEGANYFRAGADQRIFASQRIDQFDAGFKVYGEPNGRTQIGALSTLDFGNKGVFMGSIYSQLAPQKAWTASYVTNQEDGKVNHAFQGGLDLNYGPTQYYVRTQITDDQERKTGERTNFGFFKVANGMEAGAEYVEVSPEFFPRLGFSPEQNLRGFNAFFNKTNTLKSGPLQDTQLGAQGVLYNHFDRSVYRRDLTVFGGLTFRSGIGLDFSSQWSNFEGSLDRLQSVQLVLPRGNPYRSWGIGVADGMLFGSHYQSLSVGLDYRPVQMMQVSLRSQLVDYNGYQRQHIISANYDIGKHEAVGGRLVNTEDKWNWYLSYRMSGRRGNEYYLILGDPNALEFKKALVLKVVVPVTIRF